MVLEALCASEACGKSEEGPIAMGLDSAWKLIRENVVHSPLGP